MSHLRLFIIYISCISGSWYLITPNLMSCIIQNTYIIICSWWWYAKKTHIHPKDEISTYNGTNVMMLYLLVQCDVRYISHNITVIMVTQWYVYSLMCVVYSVNSVDCEFKFKCSSCRMTTVVYLFTQCGCILFWINVNVWTR